MNRILLCDESEYGASTVLEYVFSLAVGQTVVWGMCGGLPMQSNIGNNTSMSQDVPHLLNNISNNYSVNLKSFL